MTDQYPVPGQPEGSWQPATARPPPRRTAPAGGDHAPARPGARRRPRTPTAGQRAGRLAHAQRMAGPPGQPRTPPPRRPRATVPRTPGTAPHTRAAGYPGAPAAGAAWQSQTSAYPTQPGYGYRARAACRRGNWQYDTAAFAAAGAPPVAPPTAPPRSGSGRQAAHRPDPRDGRPGGPALRRARRVRGHAGRLVHQRDQHGGPAPVRCGQVRAPARHRRRDRREPSAPPWSPSRSPAPRAPARAPAS